MRIERMESNLERNILLQKRYYLAPQIMKKWTRVQIMGSRTSLNQRIISNSLLLSLVLVLLIIRMFSLSQKLKCSQKIRKRSTLNR